MGAAAGIAAAPAISQTPQGASYSAPESRADSELEVADYVRAHVSENGDRTTPLSESDIDRIKNALQARRKSLLITAIDAARVARIEDAELYLEFTSESRHARDTLARPDHIKIIRDACQEICEREMGLRLVLKDPEQDESAPMSREETERREKKQLREEAEQDPFVQQMLRTFRGEILDVQHLSDS